MSKGSHSDLPPHSVTQLIVHMMHISKIQKTAFTFVWTKESSPDKKKTQWEKAGCSVPSSMYWMVDQLVPKMLPHQSIPEPTAGKPLTLQLLRSRSSCPGHSPGEAVTRQSGATLEWYLMDYRGHPARHCGARIHRHPRWRNTPPLDSEICMISPREQHKYHWPEKKPAVLAKPAIIPTSASL